MTESGTDFDYSTYVGLLYTGTYDATLGYRFNNMSFVKGTAKTYTRTTNFSITYVGQSTTEYMQMTVALAYDGDDTFTLSVSAPPAPAHSNINELKINATNSSWSVIGNSTKSSLGNPMYIDCEFGEAYKVESGSAVSVNDAVSLPAKLPVLRSGANTITADNTVTDLKVIPRWWKI